MALAGTPDGMAAPKKAKAARGLSAAWARPVMRIALRCRGWQWMGQYAERDLPAVVRAVRVQGWQWAIAEPGGGRAELWVRGGRPPFP